MLKNKINWIVVILAFITILTGCNKRKSFLQISNQNPDLSIEEEVVIDYLHNNYSIVDLEDENKFNDLAFIDSELEGKEIFFTGEYHGINANEKLRMKFLKYFKEKADFIYYLCELGYSNAYFLNKYLETGDLTILEEMYKPLKGTYEWNKDNYNHWKKLYEYNKTLPEDKRIKVVGVDIEHQIDNAYRYLVDVLPNKEVPMEIREIIDEMKSILSNFDGNKAVGHSRKLLKDMENKESVYKEYLGENYFGFKLVNQNILNTYESYQIKNQEDWNNTRDAFIYENFKLINDNLPTGKFYGQWGLNHAFQMKEQNVMWFGAYLNDENSTYKDKVLTIAYLYDDCYQMGKRGKGRYSVDKMNTIPKTIKKANDLIGGSLNIYKLNKAGSPFFELSMFDTFEGKETEGKIVDFFQYIVCIKNSQSTEPLNDEYN